MLIRSQAIKSAHVDVDMLSASLVAAGLEILAQVQERAYVWDVAALTRNGNSLIIRATDRVCSEHYTALCNMVVQGDFDRAILVYCDKQNSVLSDEIETWWIGDIEGLVASLAAESPKASRP